MAENKDKTWIDLRFTFPEKYNKEEVERHIERLLRAVEAEGKPEVKVIALRS